MSEKDEEIQECEMNNEGGGEHSADDLDKRLDEPSFQTGVLEIHDTPNQLFATLSNLPSNPAAETSSSTETMTEHRISLMVFSRSDFHTATMRSLPCRTQDADLKIAIKIACLVISVSVTAIVCFLAEFPKKQMATITSRILFEAGILIMSTSFFFALILLILSSVRLNFSCLILVVRGFMWVSAGLMTLSIVLLLVSYFQTT